MDGNQGGSDDGRRPNDTRGAEQGKDARSLSRAEYIRRLQQAKAQRHRELEQLESQASRFLPGAHEQVSRLFRDWRPAWYALEGTGTRQAMIESNVALLAGKQGYMLTDQEAQAVGDHVNSLRDAQMAFQDFSLAAITYLTLRQPGRGTFRFPFLQPAYKFRGGPIGAGRLVQVGWHCLRFFAYTAVWTLTVNMPVALAVTQSKNTAFRNDPRLKGLLSRTADTNRDATAVSAWDRPVASLPPSRQDQTESPFLDSWPDESAAPAVEIPRAQTEVAWSQAAERGQNEPLRQSDQVQQDSSSSSWDGPVDDIDDASPVASASRLQPGPSGASAGGSAWDRIRRQSQPRQGQQEQQQQSRQAWDSMPAPEQQQRSPSGSWRGYRSPEPHQAYSGSDTGKTEVRDQAQQEFDRLLERERQGRDQDGGGWDRR